ncbi:MAG: hypothetical protein Q4C04_04195 [Clostridia bacterium]|nr:hypothetical protein [Clostridia bacterium]
MKKRIAIIFMGALLALIVAFAAVWWFGGHIRVDGKWVSKAGTESLTLTQAMLNEPESIRGLSNLKLIDARGVSLTKAEYDELREAFPSVDILYMVPLSSGAQDNTLTELVLPSIDEADVELLSDFPNLTLVDGSACDNPELLMRLSEERDYTVLWTVGLGEERYACDAEELTLADAGLSVEEIIAAAGLLPELQRLDIAAAGLSNADTARLLEGLPELEIKYFVLVEGQQYPPDTQSLDFSGAEISNFESFAGELGYLPELREVTLTNSSLSGEERLALRERYENVDFGWTVDLWDLKVDDFATELDLSGYSLSGNEEIMEAIAFLPDLERVDMCGCGLDDYQMAELADAYPSVRFIWEIDLGFWGKLRTDATAFTTRSSKSDDELENRLTSEDIWALRYCVDLEALDLGHQQLTDLSALENCTKLKVLILADNRISDLSPLANMTELVWLELFMNRISDLSPLSGLSKLTDLNLCTNRIEELTPLYSLTGLKRLWYSNNEYSSSDAAALAAVLTGCHCNRTVWDETSDGWRETEEYNWMRAFFENSPRYK